LKELIAHRIHPKESEQLGEPNRPDNFQSSVRQERTIGGFRWNHQMCATEIPNARHIFQQVAERSIRSVQISLYQLRLNQ
jgi:hypothetical protein